MLRGESSDLLRGGQKLQRICVSRVGNCVSENHLWLERAGESEVAS